MLEEYNSVSRNREELDGRVEEWLQEVQRKLIDDAEQAKLQTSRHYKSTSILPLHCNKDNLITSSILNSTIGPNSCHNKVKCRKIDVTLNLIG